MSYISAASVSHTSISNESPLSPNMEHASGDEVAVIPVYSVSDSDEDRANALMKSISRSLQENVGQDFSAPERQLHQVPVVQGDEELVQIVDISEGQEMVEDTPSIQVMFMNTDIGRRYRHDIEEFFHTLMTTENLSKDREPLPKIQRRPNLKPSDGDDPGVIDETTVIGTISVYRSFMLDKQGWPMIANMLNQTPGISIPDYIQLFAETYPPPEDAKLLEARPIKTSKKCFNCGEDGHEVRKCPKPFDKRTFSKNRAKFLATGLQYGRYHKEEKNRKMKPGEISDSLRQTLGLRDDELPNHIYRMRRLGYPPGWLLQAEATNSGLAMFDTGGQEVNLDGNIMEDGQVPEHRIRDEDNLKYNSDQLIMYPGFNVPCPVGVSDKSTAHRGYPRMKPEHSLDVMSSNINLIHKDSLNEEKPLKRNRYESTSENPKRFKASHIDMELSEGEDDAGDIIEVPGPPSNDNIDEYQVLDELPPEPDTPHPDDVAPATPSLATVSNINETISALEETKKKLLAELCEMEGTMTSSTPLAEQSAGVGTDREDGLPPILDLGGESEGEDATPQPSYQSMSYIDCTPVIQHSGISKLPSYDKFSDGITEHLAYENLPNATGVYQKMSGVIKDVKDRMAALRPQRRTKK